ncbi:MAG TPA: hypothetical protein VGN13_12285 [Solirubrobacteraceae bacterium]|jgi:hypothetical protein
MSATVTDNGTEQAVFPLDSYREAARYLRRPFAPAAIKFKVQATWPKDDPKNALVVSYMDARLVVDRLNLVVPHLWFDEYEPAGQNLLCRLTVDGVTRRDIGEGTGKALYSDALKRAAVKFGIGVSLYAVPKMILKGSDVKGTVANGKKSLAMTSDGERTVRAIYETWLTDHGSQAFGEPLDHGDVEGAQGDYEAEVEPAEAARPSADRLLTDDERDKVLKAVEGSGQRLDLLLAALGIETAAELSTSHAFEIRARLDEAKP